MQSLKETKPYILLVYLGIFIYNQYLRLRKSNNLEDYVISILRNAYVKLNVQEIENSEL